jgi:glycosyltransferase involved in cell wall biosynthesis
VISIFTPSHDPRWLGDAYDSLCKQSIREWEWIVVLNRGAEWGVSDPRVKIHRGDGIVGIGALKSYAVSMCAGKILVELDHDDRLAPKALSRIRRAVREGAGVAYSDFAEVTLDGGYRGQEFGQGNGWEYRDEVVAGRAVKVCSSFDPYPSAVGYVWYAPNHVRAFTREAYDAAGGYDAALQVCDDHDLLCRLYEVAEFKRIPECLYLQRVHDGNTQRDPALNAEIQFRTIELHDRYVRRLCRAWAMREGLEVFTERDLPDIADADDSSVGLLVLPHTLQLLAPEDREDFWQAAYRVLAHGAMVLTLTPMPDAADANWSTRSRWTARSFLPLTSARYRPVGRDWRFQATRLVEYDEQGEPWICANLTCVKDGPRLPGPLLV